MELKPCPFCGKIPQIFENEEKRLCVVGCNSCNVAIFDKDLETAVDRWNIGDFDG